MELNYKTILVESREVATILTLNRPEQFNAINQEMVDEIHHLLTSLRRELPSVLVITGAGGKAFAAGADIKELRDRRSGDALANINGGLFDAIARFPAPTIAAIQGYALGGGLELALACDLRVCGRGSRLGQPEVSLGIIPGAGATTRLPRLVGPALAKELIFTGAKIRADRAYEIGLVNRVVDDGTELEVALELGAQIHRNSREAILWAKSALNQANDVGDGGAAMMAQYRLFESDDKHRRMTAFIEKRG